MVFFICPRELGCSVPRETMRLVLGLGCWVPDGPWVELLLDSVSFPILSVLGGDKVGRKESEDVARGRGLFLRLWDTTSLHC